MNRAELERKFLLIRELQIRKAREDFFTFCKLMIPDFYKDDRVYLKNLCNTLQKLYEGKLRRKDGYIYRRLIINCPPRHGKSLTLGLFTQWLLGKDNTNRIITASYNDDLATQFSRGCRDGISKERDGIAEIVYSDIFTNTKIKYGDASFKKWALEGQFFTYKGVGLGSGVTGMGCNISISDDLIKDSATAFSPAALKKINDWYKNTFASRREDVQYNKDGSIKRNSIEIICFTRWSSKDLCGEFLSDSNPEKDTWYVLKMKAYNEETGEMLCDEVLSYERYMSIKANMDAIIFEANYNQKEIDSSNRLYDDIRTYKELPKDEDGNIIYDKFIAVLDTADTGTDSTVCMTGYIQDGDIYILDIYGSRGAMEDTEEEVADNIYQNQPDECNVESNNGGRGYRRSVERILKEKYGYRHTIFEDEPQTKNKETRILSNAHYVKKHVYMPLNWHLKYPDAFDEITGYSRVGKNEHDDYVDMMTKLAEIAQEENNFNVRFI